jgi:secondary thiamine-phosphate synthase enzyme
MHKLKIHTKTVNEFCEITSGIQDIVTTTGIKSGICMIFVPHTTAAVTINEHADPDVVEDIINSLNSIVPSHINYKHSEGNSLAHVKASLIGSSQLVIIENGNLVLGTWQGIFLCEFDGPRTRTIFVDVLIKDN